jgi:O-acetyl-ADP-ribose deacetylase (regulator of RNase III)
MQKLAINTIIFVSFCFIGIFGVPKDICTQQYQKAVTEFSHKFHRDTTIKEIHFVDIDKGMCSLIQKTFGSEFGKGIKM